MSSKRMLVAMALLATLIAPLGFAADSKTPKAKKSEATAKTEKAPRLTIVQPVKDFGTVAKGEKLDWSFEIRNTGNADLQILAAKPGCGCTVADFDKVIKPGATGKVTAHVDTTNFSGPIAKPVTLETNDASAPTAQLTIHAVVKPYVEAYPAGFVRFMLLQGDVDTQSIKLYSEEEEPFEIKEIQVPGDWVKVTYNKIENAADRAPNVGAAATRSVIVHSNDLKTPERFQVTKVESTIPNITTAVKPGMQKGDYEVTLQVAPNSKPGDIEGAVKIYTSDKVNPVVTVPVKGTIKAGAVAGTSTSK